VPAQFEEAVMNADLRDIQHLLPDSSKMCFEFSPGHRSLP
jgi:hypothetical protein